MKTIKTITILMMMVCIPAGFSSGLHTEGGGSDLAARFVSESHRIIQRIERISQAVVRIEDLKLILNQGIKIIVTPILFNPDTGEHIFGNFDAYVTNKGLLQLLSDKWELYLKPENMGKYDVLISHELLRLAGYDDEGYKISIGILRLQEIDKNFTRKDSPLRSKRELDDLIFEANEQIEKEQRQRYVEEEKRFRADYERRTNRKFTAFDELVFDGMDPRIRELVIQTDVNLTNAVSNLLKDMRNQLNKRADEMVENTKRDIEFEKELQKKIDQIK